MTYPRSFLALLLIGAFSYRVVERPFLDYKRFFVARTSGA